MPKLTKVQFAELVRSMPNASHEEILNAATQAENATPAEEPSTLKKVWDFANTPLTDAPSRLARMSADQIDAPSLTSERDTIDIPGFGKFNSRGFVAGITQGAGDVASSLTSPLNLALTALGFGGEAAGARGALGISKAARTAEKALMVPIAGEGASNAYEGVKEGDYAKAGMGAAQVAGAAAGVKNAGEHAFPPTKVRDAYMASKGRELTSTPKVEKLDTGFAKRTADAYEAMPHTPQHPAVAAAYKAMADETSDQFKFLRDEAGVKMEPWTKEGQPYANSKEMMTDVLKNNRLFYFPSEAGFGQGVQAGDFPLLKTGKSGAPVNDEFRAAHDYFGHAVEGNQFGPLGEERAYQAHRQMFPKEAVPALTTETRGQNSWVNFGRHLRRDDGTMPKAGDPDFVRPQDRPFAEQKTGLLPKEFYADATATSPKPESLSTGTAVASPSGPAYGLDDAAVKVSELTRQNGGASFNLHHGDLINSDNYAVSVYPDRGVVIDGQASPKDIASFVHKNQDLLQDPKNSIGTWFNKDDGKTYLDVSVTVPSLDDALRLGQEKGQVAIFDLKNLKEINVPKAGRTASAPEVTPMAGDVPAEFHAVEAHSGEPSKGLAAPPQVEDQPFHYGSGKKVAEQKQKLDAFRAQAAEQRGEVSAPRGAGLATASAIAAPAAAAAVPDDPNSEWDDWARVALMGVGGLGMAAAHFPKGLKREMDAIVTKTRAEVKAERGGKIGADTSKIETNLRNFLRDKFPQNTEKQNHMYGTYRTIPLPTNYEGVNFDARYPVEKLLKLGRDKAPEFSNISRARLEKAYEVGNKVGSEWGTTEHLGRLTGNDPEAAQAIARMWGAFSPGTSTGSNTLQGIEGFIRAYMNGENPKDFVKNMSTANARRPKAVTGNVERVQKGGRIYQKKTEALAAGEVGLNDLPIDLWFLRALGANYEKSPPAGVYEAIKNAANKMAAEKGEGLFPFMAKAWTGIQHIAGTPTPSFSRTIEKAGVPANITHPEVADWFLRNGKELHSKVGGRRPNVDQGPSLFDEPAPQVHTANRYSDEEFRNLLQKKFVETRLKGDVLGKNKTTKAENTANVQLLEQVMKALGAEPDSAKLLPFEPKAKPGKAKSSAIPQSVAK